MAGEAGWPSSLRPIGKYLARASEIEASEPIVSYYCTLFSLKTAFKIRDKNDPNASKLVRSLLEKCEVESARVGTNQEEHKQIVQDYATKIFRGADDEDRAGKATLETAKTFYSAMCFLEVCKNFGELDPGLEEKLKYAKYKVATITKAIREGRKPEPGPPGGSEASPATTNNSDASASQVTEAPAGDNKPLYPDIEPDAAPTDSTAPVAPNGTASAPFYPQRGQEETSHSQSPIYPQSGNLQPDVPPTAPLGEPPLSRNESGSEDFTALAYKGGKYPPNPPEYPSQDAPSPLNSFVSSPQYGSNPSLGIPSAPPPAAPTAPLTPKLPPTIPSSTATPPESSRDPYSQEKPGGAGLGGLGSISTNSPPLYPTPAAHVTPTPAPVAPPPPVQKRQVDPNYQPNPSQVFKAQQKAKNAVSALDFQDMKTAVAELEQALTLLTGQGR